MSQFKLNYTRFTCIYANSLAQVYRCDAHSIRSSDEKERDRMDPTRNFVAGECYVLYKNEMLTTEGQLVYRYDHAIHMCEMLWRAADEEDRFGALTGPRAHILYANENYEVLFQPLVLARKPFMIHMPEFSKILLNKRGSILGFSRLDGAIEKADELNTERKANRRGG